MTNSNRPKSWRVYSLVPVAGALGGLCILLFEMWINNQTGLTYLFDHLYIYMPLGAASSLIFVFIISNVDFEDPMKLFVFALVAGLAWQPILRSAGGVPDDKRPSTINKVAKKAQEQKQETTDDQDNNDTSGQNPFTRLMTMFFSLDLSQDDLVDIPTLDSTGEQSQKRDYENDDKYRLDIETPGEIIINVETREEDKDLFAILYRKNDEGGWTVISTDDDTGVGWNPRLELDSIDVGEYLLVLNSIDGGDVGRTRISVTR